MDPPSADGRSLCVRLGLSGVASQAKLTSGADATPCEARGVDRPTTHADAPLTPGDDAPAVPGAHAPAIPSENALAIPSDDAPVIPDDDVSATLYGNAGNVIKLLQLLVPR